MVTGTYMCYPKIVARKKTGFLFGYNFSFFWHGKIEPHVPTIMSTQSNREVPRLSNPLHLWNCFQYFNGDDLDIYVRFWRLSASQLDTLHSEGELLFPGCQWYGEMLCGGAIVRVRKTLIKTSNNSTPIHIPRTCTGGGSKHSALVVGWWLRADHG